MSTATVTMPIDEYVKLKQLLDEKDEQVKKLLSDLNAARAEDPSNRVGSLNQLVRDAMPVVQFAMANMSPRDIKRWPADKLRSVAVGIASLADYSSHDEELAAEMQRFASECDEWERVRKTTAEKEVPAPFPVEDHPIAQLMMGGKPGASIESPGKRIETQNTESTTADS